MLNVRNCSTLLAAIALVIVPVAGSFAADVDGKKAAPVLDLNARMQQKLNAKLNGNVGGERDPSAGLDSKLSERVDEQKAEVEQQLDEQAQALTDADRGGEDSNDGAKAETATQ